MKPAKWAGLRQHAGLTIAGKDITQNPQKYPPAGLWVTVAGLSF
jgi:hypothetical protein